MPASPPSTRTRPSRRSSCRRSRSCRAWSTCRCRSTPRCPAAIEAALKVAKGRPLVNSVTGEEEKLEAILPLVKKYNVPVVAISNDETGISMDPDVRFAVAKKIVQRAADYGIPPHDIVVDPLVMPIGALGDAGRQVFALLRRLREELKVNTTCGALQHLVRPAAPSRHQRRLPPDGDRRRHDLGDHEPVPAAGDGSGARRQRAERHRRDCTTWIRTYKDYKPAEARR